MRSLRSKFFIWLLKNRHLLKLKLKPQVVDESFSVKKFREDTERASAERPLPRGIRVEPLDPGEIRGEWLLPPAPAPGKVLLYIHGGGFISGSCQTHRRPVAEFALQTGLKSLLFDYRLAPEHPFPSAVEDCVSAYTWLQEQGYNAGDIVVGGESAGGTLVLSLLLALKEKGLALPKAAFSISPVTDLRCLADSFLRNRDKDIAPRGAWNLWLKMYIGDTDPLHPLLSPQMGDFHRMPPLYICAGTYEIHLDDCRNMAEKIESQGSPVILKEWPGMVHAFPLLSPLFPEAKKALEEICCFVRGQLNVGE